MRPTFALAKILGLKYYEYLNRPNGTPRKLLDVSKATALGWTYKTKLPDGIRLAYDDFLNNPIRAER